MKKDSGFSRKLIILLTCLNINLLSCTHTIESETDDIKTTTAATTSAAETEAENQTETSEGLPPLVIDTSAPLLLDEPGEEEQALADANTKAAKENTACFVCHGNYRAEFIVKRHAQVNIGCFHCHGESSAHQNDENNTTPPETMYSADMIEPLCRKCHTTHSISPNKIIANYLMKKTKEPEPSCEGCHESDDVRPEKIIARWKEQNLEKIEPEKIVCTDCHGEHRMKVRTIIWDKKTGKLLRTNKGD